MKKLEKIERRRRQEEERRDLVETQEETLDNERRKFLQNFKVFREQFEYVIPGTL